MNDLDHITTRPVPPTWVQPCGYCTGDIMWIQLANETWRTFEPFEVYAASAPARLLEIRGWMLHRDGHAIALSALTAWPDWVLVTHMCTAYLLALEDSAIPGRWGDTPTIAEPAELARERFGDPRQIAGERIPAPAQVRAAAARKARRAAAERASMLREVTTD